MLNSAAKLTKKLTIRWVKAHANSNGNNKADTLANEGRQLQELVKKPPDLAWGQIRSEISSKTNKYWNWALQQDPTCRQTKQWLPRLNQGKSHQIMLLPKLKWGKIVQFITGHNSLNRHLVLTGVDPEEDINCYLCKEEDMTSAHIMGTCPALIWVRAQTTGSFLWDPPFDIAIGKQLNFMQQCGVKPLQWQ